MDLPPNLRAMTPREMEAAVAIVTRIRGERVGESIEALLTYAADSLVKLNREAHRAREGWAGECLANAQALGEREDMDKAAVAELLGVKLERVRGLPVDAAAIALMLGHSGPAAKPEPSRIVAPTAKQTAAVRRSKGTAPKRRKR